MSKSQWYRYDGLPDRQRDGSVLKTGDVFEATDRERERIERRSHYQEFFTAVDGPEQKPRPEAKEPEVTRSAEPDDVAPSPEDSGEGASSDEQVEEDSDEVEWDLKVSPETYLERHPLGPNAALARRILHERENE